MDIQPRTTVAAPIDDKAWLADDHGIDSTLSGTIQVADFDLSPGEVLPGGTLVVLDSGSGFYKPAFALNTDEPPVLEQIQASGHIYESVVCGAGDNLAVAVLWHGVVASDRVPVPAGETFSAALGAPHVLYV